MGPGPKARIRPSPWGHLPLHAPASMGPGPKARIRQPLTRPHSVHHWLSFNGARPEGQDQTRPAHPASAAPSQGFNGARPEGQDQTRSYRQRNTCDL